MPKIYFEDDFIIGEYTYDGSLWIKMKNKKSRKYLKQWAKRKDSRNIVLVWLDKIWLMLDCKPFHHKVEKFEEGGIFSFTFTHDRGVVLTKDSEYLEIPWIKNARRELRKKLKEQRMKNRKKMEERKDKRG